jgi:hypothetical protein
MELKVRSINLPLKEVYGLILAQLKNGKSCFPNRKPKLLIHLRRPRFVIAIFIYRRPDLVAGLLNRLRHHRPEKVWLIADGPKKVKPEETEYCIQARQTAEKLIDWPCEVRRVYAETNLGLKQRFESGLDALFMEESEAIILEEDCHPESDFFPFCVEMLDRYREEPRVGGISGNCFLPRRHALETDYFFSRYLHIWGWATWARAWHSYNRTRWNWPARGYREYFPGTTRQEEKYWNHIFARVSSGHFSTWDYPWASWFWRQRWVSITPAENLVRNVGFGPEATNTRDLGVKMGIERENRLQAPYQGPTKIQADPSLDRAIFENHFLRTEGKLGFWPRLIRSIGKRMARA